MMKTLNSKNRLKVLSLVTMTLLAAGCSRGEVTLGRAQQNQAQGTIGMKNFQQLALSMSQVTGVPMTQMVRDEGANRDIRLSDHAATIGPWLSQTGSALDVNASMILSITGFAGMFCKAFLTNEAAAAANARIIHGSVNFTAGASALPASSSELVNQYALRFWRREPTNEEKRYLEQALQEAVDELRSGTQNSTSAQRALLVPCTVALASLEFLKS